MEWRFMQKKVFEISCIIYIIYITVFNVVSAAL